MCIGPLYRDSLHSDRLITTHLRISRVLLLFATIWNKWMGPEHGFEHNMISHIFTINGISLKQGGCKVALVASNIAT